MNVITCPHRGWTTTLADPKNCGVCRASLVTHHWREGHEGYGTSENAYATSIPVQQTPGKAAEGWRNGYGDAWRLAPVKAPPTCATCRFFRPDEPWPSITPEELAAITGQCKRRSPSPTAFYPWPRIVAQDWCGEHEEGARP